MLAVYILLGLQGSGKTTWAKANAKRLNAVVLSSDDIRNEMVEQGQAAEVENGDAVFAIFNRRLAGLVRAGHNAISDATHIRRAWRQNEIEIARSLGAKVVGVWLDVPLEVCLRRNVLRPGGAWGQRAVAEDFVRELAESFEPPLVGEFDEVWKVTPPPFVVCRMGEARRGSTA